MMSVEVGAWATPWTILVSVNLGFTPYGNRTWQGHFPLDPQKHETRDAGDTAFWVMSTPKNSTPGLLCICAIFLPFLRKTSLIHQSGFVNPGLGFLIKKKNTHCTIPGLGFLWFQYRFKPAKSLIQRTATILCHYTLNLSLLKVYLRYIVYRLPLKYQKQSSGVLLIKDPPVFTVHSQLSRPDHCGWAPWVSAPSPSPVVSGSAMNVDHFRTRKSWLSMAIFWRVPFGWHQKLAMKLEKHMHDKTRVTVGFTKPT